MSEKSGLEKSLDKRAVTALVKVGNAIEAYRALWRAQQGAAGKAWSDDAFAVHIGEVTASMARKAAQL